MKLNFNFNFLKTVPAKTKKFVWFLGLHAFSVILILILIDLVIGGFTFYKYAFLAERQQPKTAGGILKFDSKSYQEIMNKLNVIGPVT